MNMLEAILRRPKTVMMVMLAALLGGIFSFILLPKENQPEVPFPSFYISVSLQGISPTDAERLLIRPFEDEILGMEGLDQLTATATTGHASIFAIFRTEYDPDLAQDELQKKIDRAKTQLPEDADEPTLTELSANNIATLTTVIYGDVPERTLFKHARQLRDELEEISTVRDVTMSGHREEILEILINLDKMESLGMTAPELIDAVAQNNLIVPAGNLDTGQGDFAIEVPGLIKTATDVFTLPIKYSNGRVVTLGDIGEIRRTFEDARHYTRVNGRPAISLAVNKLDGASILETSEHTHEIIDRLRQEWPSSIQMTTMVDQSRFALNMLNSLSSAVLTAITLVMIVTVAMMGIRPALMVGLAIPVSFMIGFLLLAILGYTINMMIMFGLVLTVGMLVDGAIVIVEYADRKISEGTERKEAFIRAAKMMFWPIASSTATTLAVFMPLLFWPDVIGKFMSYLPIMVIIVLISSFITAMIFLPVAGRFIARKKVSEAERFNAEKLSGSRHFDPQEIKGLTGSYLRLLQALLKKPTRVVLAGFASIVAVFWLYIGPFNTGAQQFPEIEPEFFNVFVSARGNLSPAEKRDLLLDVEKQILATDGFEATLMNFGTAGAITTQQPSDVIGTFLIQLDPFKDRYKGKDIFADMRERFAKIAGIRIEIAEQEQGPPVAKDIAIDVLAENYEDLGPVVTRIRNQLESMGGIIEEADERPLPGIDWEINIDRELAAQYGIGVRDISPYIQLVTSGVSLGTYRPNDADEELDIKVRLPREQRTFEQLDGLSVVTPQGNVPVANFIERSARPKVANIERLDGNFSMFVGGNVDEGFLTPDKSAELQEWIDGQTWPDTVSFKTGGEQEQQQETAQFFAIAYPAAMVFMFLILLTQFNSFYQTFVTLSTVIMSIAGVFIGMMLTGQQFSAIMTMVGIISLAGIVVNNAIVLIDTFNRFKNDGTETEKAVLMTAAQRLRPVMLTTITTVFGLIPMALGVSVNYFSHTVEIGSISGAWWIQLSTAVISGLLCSTLLTLIMVPVMLAAGPRWGAALSGLFFGIINIMRSLRASSGRKPTSRAGSSNDNINTPDDEPIPQAAE